MEVIGDEIVGKQAPIQEASHPEEMLTSIIGDKIARLQGLLENREGVTGRQEQTQGQPEAADVGGGVGVEKQAL